MFALTLVLVGVLSAGESLTSGPLEEVADGYEFTEGPLWLAADEKWIFSDVVADTVYDSNGERHLKPSGNINGLAIDNDGRIVACQSGTHSIVRFERNGQVSVLASELDGKALNSTNDLVVRSDGVIFFTDPKPLRRDFESALGYAGVFALWPESGELKAIATDLKYSNGIALSPDEKTLYVSDTNGSAVYAYPLNGDGTVGSAVNLCRVIIPDGMTVDAQGNLWTATSKGVVVTSAAGELIETIEVPVMPTNCAFGGADNQTLLITARAKVFRIQTRVSGH